VCFGHEKSGAKRRKLMASKVGRHLTHSRFRNENQKLRDEDDRGTKQKAIKKSIREVKAERVLWHKCETSERAAQRKSDVKAWEDARDVAKKAGQGLPKKPKVLAKEATPDHIKEKLEGLEEDLKDADSSSDEEDNDCCVWAVSFGGSRRQLVSRLIHDD